jgi:exosortase/archaeosortase family protein
MNEKPEISKPAIIKLFILISLCAIAYWPEIKPLIHAAPSSSELAHTAAFPIAAILLIYLRRDSLKQSLSTGSGWGVGILASGILMYALCIWPFTFGYARQVAVIPSLAGIILACCGWRFLKASAALLLICLVAIPIGPRLYANLAMHPETVTIDATARTLNILPGNEVKAVGSDLLFKRQSASGVIALGESNRGARLFFAFALIGLFVIFCEHRSRWRVLGAIAFSIPIILLTNFVRLLTESLITIYAGIRAESSAARDISTAFSLMLVYALFVVIVYGNWNLYIEEHTENNSEEPKYAG